MFIPYKIEEEIHYSGKPVLVWSFCVVYIAAYIVLFHVVDVEAREDIFYRFGCVPIAFKWWTPLTCTYLHGNFMHLAGNLYFFWIYGKTCERAIGFVRFLILYIAGAFASVLIHVATVPSFYRDVPTIGASGAISAVLGAFLVLFPTIRVRFLVFSFAFSRPLPSHGPAYLVLGVWFIAQIAYGLQLVGEVMGVAFWAHIGGFAAGAVIGSLYLLLQHLFAARERKIDDVMKSVLAPDCDQERAKDILVEVEEGIELGKVDEAWRFQIALMERELQVGGAGGVEERATGLAVASFAAAKERNDYGVMCQCYYWLLHAFPEHVFPDWFHREGAVAAMRMGHVKLALYGYYLALISDEGEFSKRILTGLSVALKKLGKDEPALQVEQAAALCQDPRGLL